MSGINCVSAESEVNVTQSCEGEEELRVKDDDTVSASEDGHFNISFDDGYSGYCINYGQKEAQKGDDFTQKDTSHAVNNNNGDSVGNELKTFFVDYYDIAMKDKIKTQHIIWHFTDGFNGWRVDPNLMEEIRNTSSNKIIPDHGATRKINDTSEMVFDFEVLSSDKPGNQNYFAYKITIRDIIEDIFNGTSNNTLNSAENNRTEDDLEMNKNQTKENNNTVQDNDTSKSKSDTSPKDDINTPSRQKTTAVNDKRDNDSENKINLEKHKTGYNYIPALVILIFGTLLLIKYYRD